MCKNSHRTKHSHNTPFLLMNLFNMSNQFPGAYKTIITLITFMNFFMWLHMFFQQRFYRKWIITSGTFMRLCSFMNWSHMCFQSSFLEKISITDNTIELFALFIVSFRNMSNQCFFFDEFCFTSKTFKYIITASIKYKFPRVWYKYKRKYLYAGVGILVKVRSKLQIRLD